MSCDINSSNINQTFIIEPMFVTAATPTITACTAVYTNSIICCDYPSNEILLNSGDTIFNTSITTPIVNSYDLQLGNRIIQYENQSGASLVGKFLSGTSNGFILSDISNIKGIDTYVTGGTYSNGTTIFTNNFGNIFSVTGYLSTDTYVTGGTYSNGTTIFKNNFGNIFSVTGYQTVDTYVTGGTFSSGTTIFTNNSGGTFSITGYASIDTYITGGTYDKVSGTTKFTNNFGNTFDVTGYFTGYTYTPENISNKQNSMVYDGTGVKFPTVDAVNIQANNLARATTQTGFIDTSDGFTMYVADNNTLGISGSTIGIAFSQLFKTPPFTPSSAIVQLTSRTIPLSNIGLIGTGTSVKFVGYRQSDDSIVFSDTSLVQSPTICQLGIILVKYSGGVTSFIDANRNFINQPDISAYSNLETTGFGVKSSVIVDNNGTDLKIKNTGGNFIGISVNWHGINNDLQRIIISDPTGTTFTYLYPVALLSSTPPPFVSDINPTLYWNGSSLVSLGSISAATVQRFLVTIRGTIAVQYSEFVYNTFNDALNNASVQTFSDVLPLGTFAEVGRLIVTSGCTNLSDTSKAVFITTGAGGGSTVSPTVVSWGSITGNLPDQTDLQNALDSKQALLSNPITGIGVTNQVAFFNSTNSISGSTGFTWDNTNKRLGINGTPAYALEVFGLLTGNVSDNIIRVNSAAKYVSITVNSTTSGGLGQASMLFQKNGVNTWGFGVDIGSSGIKDFYINDGTNGTNALYVTNTGEVRLGSPGTNATGGYYNTQKMTIKTNGNVLIGNINDTGDRFQVSGTSRFYTTGNTGTTVLISSNTQNSLVVVGSGNSTTLPIFSVQGSQGELFSVNDSLTGSLFSVNDISGLPIIEAFSDNTILMGSFQAPALNTTIKVIANIGTTNIYSIPTSAYTGAWVDYTVNNGLSLRAGSLISVFSGTNIQYTETSTTDIGNTSGITFSMIISGSSALLRASGVTSGWTVKSIIRSI